MYFSSIIGVIDYLNLETKPNINFREVFGTLKEILETILPTYPQASKFSNKIPLTVAKIPILFL